MRHSPLSFQRLALAILPALVLVSVAVAAIWGDNGLTARHQLRLELEGANDRLAAIDTENQVLLWNLVQMERDPIVLERIIADELAWGPPGAVLYRFESE